MTKWEAKAFLYSIAGDLGFSDAENYTCKDGEKMREAIMVLEESTSETVTEFADRCRECGAKYGKWLKQGNYTNIPFLLHKEFSCPLDECVKAYEKAIEYLRSKSKLKG